jgi:uncharacterized protein with beta-barrel porin domain
LPAANGIDIYVERENSLASAAPKDQNLVAMGNFLESLGNPADPKLQGVISSLYNKSTAKEVADSMSTLFPNTSGGDVQAAASSLNASIGTIESHLELATNSNSPTNSFTGNDRPVSNGIWGQTFGNGYGNRALVDNKIGVGVGGYPVPPAAPPISSGPSGNPVKNSAWTEGFGSIISQSKRDGIEGYNANVFGFSFGADLYASPTATFGIAAAYGKTASDGNSSPNSVVSSTNSKTFESTITSQQISVYGTRNFGRTYVDLITAFAWNHYQSKRVLFDGSVAQRDSKGNQMTFKLNIGHAIETAKDTFVSPFASIQYTDLMQDSYIETGSNANLKVNPKDLKVLKSGLGFKVSSGPKLNGVNGRFFAGWYHDFYAQSVEITSSFASAPAPSISFNSKGASVPPDSVRAGLGFDLINKDGVAFSIDYIVEAKPQFIAHTGVARLKFAF